MDDAVYDSLLGLEKDGTGLMESFEERLTTDPTTATFFSPLKRNKYKSWNDSANKIVIKKDGKVKELTFQRDILGILVAHSYQYNSGIDIDSALCYPLAPVSVPLSTPDGSIRQTVKSKLFKAAMSDLSVVTDEDLPGPDRLRTYFLDLAAAVRTIVGKPETVSELAERILVMVPRQYKDTHIACDTYEENSIKGGERAVRGTSERYFLRSPDMKVPHDFAGFLRSGSNKEMLFDLIQQSIEEDRANLEDRIVYFSSKKICTMIKEDQVTVLPNLNSDHEGDTKLVALVCAANVPSEESIMVRSPSGDIDILTLFVAHDFRDTKVFIDNGTSKNRKIFEVTSSQLSAEEKKALLGVHAFLEMTMCLRFFGRASLPFGN